MRIIATADTHFPFDLEKFGIEIQQDDVFVLAGDFMYTGYPEEWYKRLASLEAIKCDNKYLVGGNHDLHLEHYPGPALQELRKAGVDVVGEPGNKHPVRKLPNGMTLLGLPFVTNLNRWAFNRTEEWIEEYLEKIGRVDIVVSHSPPMNILDTDGRSNYGIRAYRRYLSRFQPDHWIFGHVHESYGTHAQDGCIFYNVAMCNHDYAQVNPPMVIELDD